MAQRANAFQVLGISLESGRMDVERAAQRLLALLQAGAAGASAFDTPEGRRVRTAEDVREALTALRDPAARIGEEIDALASSVPAPELPSPLSVDIWNATAWRGPARGAPR